MKVCGWLLVARPDPPRPCHCNVTANSDHACLSLALLLIVANLRNSTAAQAPALRVIISMIIISRNCQAGPEM